MGLYDTLRQLSNGTHEITIAPSLVEKGVLIITTNDHIYKVTENGIVLKRCTIEEVVRFRKTYPNS